MRKAYEQDRQSVAKAQIDDHYTCTDIDTMEKIARQVPLSAINRPSWDKQILMILALKLLNFFLKFGNKFGVMKKS